MLSSPVTQLVLAVLAVLMVVGLADGAWVAPAFCKGLDCPKYTVVKKIADNIELRQYEAATWVSTKKPAMQLDEAMSGSFMKLFNYISEANEAKAKIEMTAPVVTKVEPGQGPTCSSNFTISFYLPYKYQGATQPPRPAEATVYLNKLPPMTAYVYSFGGMANGDMYKAMTAELMQKLQAAKEPFDTSHWFTAGYDSPYTVVDRHNEVWVTAQPAAATERGPAATGR